MRRGQELMGAVQMCEGAAPIDVAHDERRGARGFRDAHVHEIGVLQIDLGRRPGALDHEHLVLRRELLEAAAHRGPQAPGALAPLHARQVIAPLPEQDHLRVRVALGLEQDRIHAHLGDPPRGERLKILRASHLAARRDARVVAHVLRLERRDLESLARIPSGQCGGEQALAGTAGRAANHDGARAQQIGTA